MTAVSELDAAIDLMRSKVRGAEFNGIPAFEREPKQLLAVLLAARERIAVLEQALSDKGSEARDAARYRVLRRSVLQAPMSAGMELLTTEADIDAQCDQIVKGSATHLSGPTVKA